MPLDGARVVQGEDMRVHELRGEPDLAQEALGAQRLRHVGTEDLDGDGAVVAEVVRQVHRRHPAASQLALQAIVLAEHGGECERRIREQPREALGGRPLDARLTGRVLRQEPLRIRRERVVACAGRAEEGSPLAGRKLHRRVDERLQRLPPGGREGKRREAPAGARVVRHGASTSRSSMRALAQSRSTVRAVTPSTWAISSSESPP